MPRAESAGWVEGWFVQEGDHLWNTGAVLCCGLFWSVVKSIDDSLLELGNVGSICSKTLLETSVLQEMFDVSRNQTSSLFWLLFFRPFSGLGIPPSHPGKEKKSYCSCCL